MAKRRNRAEDIVTAEEVSARLDAYIAEQARADEIVQTERESIGLELDEIMGRINSIDDSLDDLEKKEAKKKPVKKSKLAGRLVNIVAGGDIDTLAQEIFNSIPFANNVRNMVGLIVDTSFQKLIAGLEADRIKGYDKAESSQAGLAQTYFQTKKAANVLLPGGAGEEAVNTYADFAEFAPNGSFDAEKFAAMVGDIAEQRAQAATEEELIRAERRYRNEGVADDAMKWLRGFSGF